MDFHSAAVPKHDALRRSVCRESEPGVLGRYPTISIWPALVIGPKRRVIRTSVFVNRERVISVFVATVAKLAGYSREQFIEFIDIVFVDTRAKVKIPPRAKS